MKRVTITDVKLPDAAIEVYKMYAKLLKDQGKPVPRQEELLEYSEYFNVRLNADGTWELV